MSGENQDSNQSIMLHIARLLEAAFTNTISYDTLITLLSLLCIFSVLNKNSSIPVVKSAATSPTANSVQKMLGDIMKGDGAPGPEALMALLPLLNNPQLKSKLNPATLSAMLSLMNNLGQNHFDKDKNKDKDAKTNEAQQTAQQEIDSADNQKAATQSSQGSLNWKQNF